MLRTFAKFNSKFELKNLKKFQDDKELGIAKSAYNELLETVEINTNWMNKNLENIKKWLKEKKEKELIGKKNEYRLPTNLVPFHYDIFVKPYFKLNVKPETFKGEVKIEFTCVNGTNKFVIHKDSIGLINYVLNSTTDKSFYFRNFVFSYDEDTQLMTAVLDAPFKENNNYTFFAEYTGKYFTDNLGFYRNDYKSNNNETHWLVSSQFEPVKARRAFPCFDEPAYKATFKIKVQHDDSLKAISNMPAISSKPR